VFDQPYRITLKGNKQGLIRFKAGVSKIIKQKDKMEKVN
jgi:hypothetical protein